MTKSAFEPEELSPKYECVIRVDELPKLPNRLLGRHWRARHQEKDRWLIHIGCHVLGRKPPKPLEKAHLKLTRHSAQAPDPDGLAGSWKYVIDALVNTGVLADDSSEHVTLELLWEKVAPRKGRITVEVYER